jgi:peptidoglycan/LPS O-acetylase OafA/YrhL
VFWHWQNFFYRGTTAGLLDRSTLPLYSTFFLFYEKGWMAVDIFFSLSGFIFFWLYSERVTGRRIGPVEFAGLRFSRLYPLHLITLVIVAVLQLYVRSRTGDFFVVSFNDTHHFILNLFFVSAWRTSFGDSFNAPVWSVSVEMFLYALFFALCWMGRPTWARLFALILVGSVLKFFVPIGRGVFSFFIGGATYYVYAAIVARENISRALKPLTLIVIAGWSAAALGVRLGLPEAGALGMSSTLLERAANLIVTGVMMPLTILLLALVETIRRNFGRHLALLGDISYSSYMLHFPLQLAIVALVTKLEATTDLFYSPGALVGFFVVLIGLSILSYRYVERPAQRAIRKRWPISARVLSAQP